MTDSKEVYASELDNQINVWENVVKACMKTFQQKSDPSYTLDFRWDIYQKVRKFLKIDSIYFTPSILDEYNISWYDDCYLERYEVQHFDEDFIKRCVKFLEGKGVEPTEIPSMINKIKEEILEEGIGGFENDW